MKIAIHHRPNSASDSWIEYCEKNNIQYKIVDAYANDIIKQVADCDAFMWHFHHNIYKDNLFAKQLIYVIEKQLHKITYPDYDTCWHFDDKICQKYLLESINAPLIPTYIFYSRNEALAWNNQTGFPKIFKLRSGAGSNNVQIAENSNHAKKLIDKSFSSGFQKNKHLLRIVQRWHQFRKGSCTLKWFIKGIVTPYSYKEQFYKEEIGYSYFQDFIPNNEFDIRVLVIGNRAVAAKRMNRENDFRASGSHNAIFDKKQIDIDYVKTAFDINKKLKMQSVAFDFLKNQNNEILISEISYCCGNKDYSPLGGYWTSDLQWHECEKINYCDWIMEDVIETIKNCK